MSDHPKPGIVVLKYEHEDKSRVELYHLIDDLEDFKEQVPEKIHALNELNLDQSFVTTKRELLEKLK